MLFQTAPLLAIALSCFAISSTTASKIRENKLERLVSDHAKGLLHREVKKRTGSAKVTSTVSMEDQYASTMKRLRAKGMDFARYMTPASSLGFNQKFSKKAHHHVKKTDQHDQVSTKSTDNSDNYFLNIDIKSSDCDEHLIRVGYRLDYCIAFPPSSGSSGSYMFYAAQGDPIADDDANENTDYFVLGQTIYETADCSGDALVSDMLSIMAIPPTCGKNVLFNQNYTSTSTDDASNYYYVNFLEDDDYNGSDDDDDAVISSLNNANLQSYFHGLRFSASISLNGEGYPTDSGMLMR
jgi:hypothetical protein